MESLLLNDVRFAERRGGYDPDEVDDFLRRVGRAVADLQEAVDAGDPRRRDGGGDLAAELMTVRFSPAKRGYDPDEVDHFMARAADKIGALEAKLRIEVPTGARAEVASCAVFRVVVPVGSIKAACRFYAAVLGIEGQRVSPGRHYFDCNGVILVCHDAKADGDEERQLRPNPDHVYFSTEDLDDTHRRVQDAAPSWVEDAPSVRPWGERSFYCGDPWGNPLCFVQADTAFTGGTW